MNERELKKFIETMEQLGNEEALEWIRHYEKLSRMKVKLLRTPKTEEKIRQKTKMGKDEVESIYNVEKRQDGSFLVTYFIKSKVFE